ncbi:hypothetical protein DL766_010392 [Monosporascus sp. MC13-8B]|uniref:galacturonan 1,4-alpha-galacturonidase n=1 Tax=Monosporascus cannonballus TaxID=155416 RepID=A0ABY0HJV4_9PEZI|nr:hypothetical protein DL762_001767 [Monosporascus cannonballus]RYO99897.1 hypothetical protein DL763_001180 [Monosporascus cannonballus]RYP02416.1 hypothetical protein DL766_010392 [Monosporascus sp. MC13-8B]
MRLSLLSATGLIFAVAGVLGIELPPGVPRSLEEFRGKHPYVARSTPGKSGNCRRVVTIRSSEHVEDDISAEFLDGIKEANNGGLLHLPKGELFIIGKPLDLTFLNDIDIRLDGEIRSNLLFWKWGGKDIRIYGEGVLNGQGQRWWEEFSDLGIPADNNYTYARPILFYVQNSTNVNIEGIHFKDSPIWHQLIEWTTGIHYRDVICTAHSTNASVHPANSDFFDSQNIQDLTVERAWVDVGDDCFSPKSNATNVHVNQMYCNGSHGQSIGSLGEHIGVGSYVEDVVIENVWMLNGQHGGRIKVWAGPTAGHGYVKNVTFRNFWNANNEYIDAKTCLEHPSRMNISDIVFENFSGYTSGKNGRVIARFTCSASPDAVCDNIQMRNITVESPCGGPAIAICDGISGGLGDGVPCYPSESKEAKAALADKCKGPRSDYTDKPWES